MILIRECFWPGSPAWRARRGMSTGSRWQAVRLRSQGRLVTEPTHRRLWTMSEARLRARPPVPDAVVRRVGPWWRRCLYSRRPEWWHVVAVRRLAAPEIAASPPVDAWRPGACPTYDVACSTSTCPTYNTMIMMARRYPSLSSALALLPACPTITYRNGSHHEHLYLLC